ncbi:MAG: hypothetical protein WCL51_03090 [Bacteroidota bacterium]
MEQINSTPFKNNNTLKIVCLINLLFSVILVYLDVKSYFDYKTMHALNSNSFIYMSVFEIIIITGLLLMLIGRRIGFTLYMIGQMVSYIYPIATNTGDTVWGLLTLPIVLGPIFFGIFYFRNLKKLH